jgi:hypothetical protein
MVLTPEQMLFYESQGMTWEQVQAGQTGRAAPSLRPEEWQQYEQTVGRILESEQGVQYGAQPPPVVNLAGFPMDIQYPQRVPVPTITKPTIPLTSPADDSAYEQIYQLLILLIIMMFLR